MGTRLNVCNGKDILIWEDRWVPMLDSFKVTTQQPPRSELTLVSSLIDFNRRSWKINLLKDLFQEEEVKAILHIPVGNPEGRDSIVWHFTRDGRYTVKSGVKVLMSKESDRPFSCPSASENLHMLNGKVWQSKWNLPVEPKVKNFVWRACHNALATKENLAKRLKHQNVSCCRCDGEKESLEHIFFFCPFAKAVWGSSQFNYCPDKVGFKCFWKWWNDAVMQMPEFGSFNPKGLIAYICWNIWKNRNALLFEGKMGNPIDVWRVATKEFQSYLDSQEDYDAVFSQTRTAPSWVPPPASVIKICCDASFDVEKKEAGIAAVARDHSGMIVGGANMVVRVCSAPVAEAMAIRLGCFLAIDKNWKKVILESDCAEVIFRLHDSSRARNWSTLAVEEDVLRCSHLFLELSFSFVNRGVNTLADWVAKKTRLRCCPFNWFSCPPAELLNLM